LHLKKKIISISKMAQPNELAATAASSHQASMTNAPDTTPLADATSLAQAKVTWTESNVALAKEVVASAKADVGRAQSSEALQKAELALAKAEVDLAKEEVALAKAEVALAEAKVASGKIFIWPIVLANFLA
jgi:hypothetical protein